MPEIDGATLDRLRKALDRAGYREDGVARVLGAPARLPPRSEREVRLRRLDEIDPVAVLVKLFGLPVPVGRSAAGRALGTALVDELTAAGLLEERDGAVVSRARIQPYGGLLIASDPDEPGRERPDFVTGVNRSATTLASLTLRRPVDEALDLGAGGGIQALLLSRHARLVIATDVNDRAMPYAHLNARLNGIENVKVLQGSWLEPVAGRQFDLVVANPPYVVSPETEHLFKDSGLPGDAVSRLLVERVPEHLVEGGVAQILCNWIHGVDEDWRAPLEQWVAGRGVDALLLHYASFDPLEYATAWNRVHADEPEAFASSLDRWLEYDRRLGIERISWGMLVLRRRSGARNRVRAIEVPGEPTSDAGAQLERMLDAWDRGLRGADELLDERLAPAPGARLDRRLEARSGVWGPAAGRMQLHASLGLAVPLTDEAVAVVALLDGTRTVREAATAAAGELHGEGRELAGRVLAPVRRLYDLGCLVRASGGA